MAKPKTIYRCTECGYESAKWNGKCPSCGAWNTLEEDVPLPAQAVGNSRRKPVDLSDKIQELDEVDTTADVRYHTGVGELDRVLGGGLVRGSIVLLGGEPGIGKSTLLLQICQYFGESHSVLYVSGEESAKQIKLRAQRLGVTTRSLYLLTVTDAQSICDTISASRPDIVIIDSIQTMRMEEISSSPGSLTQVRECTNLFMHTAKQLDIPIWIVGHVNKDGAIAGPKVMEHIVDTVLYFEGERNLSYRLLRAVKNRYGSTNEIGVFEMQDSGLHEVPNPSAMLLDGRPQGVSGTCVTCMMEGSRPILAEMQVLATKSGFSAPRRQTQGFDYSRMVILIAVLEKHLGLFYEKKNPGGGAVSVFLSGGQAHLGKNGGVRRSGTGRRSPGHFAHPAACPGGRAHGFYTLYRTAAVPARTERRLVSDPDRRRAESAAGVFRAGKGCERGCGKIIWAERVCIKCLCGKISPQALMGTHSG